MKKTFSLFIPFLLLLQNVYSQDQNVKPIFNDYENLIKTGGLFNARAGLGKCYGPSIGYERFISKRISLDCNYSFLFDAYVGDGSGDYYTDNYKNYGHNFELGIKYYYNITSENRPHILRNFYVGMYITPVFYSLYETTTSVSEGLIVYHYRESDVTLGPQILLGKMFNIGNRMTLELGGGIMIAREFAPHNLMEGIDAGLQVGLRLGYRY